jgi:hypothetical protein
MSLRDPPLPLLPRPRDVARNALPAVHQSSRAVGVETQARNSEGQEWAKMTPTTRNSSASVPTR